MNLEGSLEKVSSNLRQSQSKMEQLETTLRSSQEQCQSLHTESSNLKDANTELEKVKSELTEACKTQEARISGLQGELGQLQSQIQLSLKVTFAQL